MSADLSSLESDLQRLRPAPLDPSLLARLVACTDPSWTLVDPAQARLEHQLHQCAPAPLPPALMLSLETTLRDVPFPGVSGAHLIIPFPKPMAPAPRHHHTWWSAAAAVALIGAITALLVPTKQTPTKLAGHPPAAHPAHPALPAGTVDTNKLIPAEFNRGLTEARDEGVIWQSNDQPHLVLKLIYKDQMILKDAAGRTLQMEQPRVEYILLPAKTD